MKIKYLIPLCLLISFFTIQTNAQTADITEGCVPLSVNFTPPVGATTFFWEFGDGGTSTIGNAGNIYSNPGNYTVNFRLTDGGPVVGSFVIKVYAKPELTVVADPVSGCSPLDVLFTPTLTLDPNITLNSLIWIYGDGSTTAQNNANPVNHVYTQAGNFSLGIDLETNVPNCNTTFPFSNIVSVSGPSGVSYTTNPSPPSTCTGPLTVNFINTTPGAGNFTFLWDFDNGNTSTAINPPAQTYTADGVYFVSLTATDGNGCMTVYTEEVRVGPPNAAFRPQADTICVGQIIRMFNDSEPGAYVWNFGAGAFPSSSMMEEPLVQFSQGGLIEINLTVTANGCSNTVTEFVFVDDVDASFTGSTTYSCTNELTSTFTPNNLNAESYLWIFSNGDTSTLQIPTHTYTNPDTTTYSINGLLLDTTCLYVTNLSGCSAKFIFVDSIYQPNALFAPDVANGCAPLTVTFEDQSTNDNPIVLWEWDFGDGTTSSSPTSIDPTHTYNTPGEYPVQLIVTDIMGCKDTSYIFVIEVGTMLNPDFTVDQTTVCPGDTVTFLPTSFPGAENVDAWHFETDDGRSFHCFQEDQLEWAFASETGSYDATLYVEYNGCISSITKTNLVTVNGPIAEIDYLIECDSPFDVTFTNNSHDATNVSWNFGDGTDTTLANLVYTYADTGSYTVYLTAENSGTGCPASVDSAVINITNIHAEALLLDSLLCLGNMYNLDATPSLNVDERCWRGYTWYFSDPNDRPVTSSDPVYEHVFESPGFNDVRLIARDINGCLDTFDQRVRVYGVYPAFNVDDDTICLGQLVNFIDLSTADTTLSTWEWDFGDGTSSDMNPSHVFTSSSDPNEISVTLTLTDTLGCGGMLTTTLGLYEPVSEITALPDVNICLGDIINFSASDFTEQGSFLNYDWDFGNGFMSMNQAETIEYLAEGIYTVTLNYNEDATGCVGPVRTQQVSVQDYPDADFITSIDGQAVVCYPETVTFTNLSTSNHALDFLWNFGNGSPPDNMNPNPAITFDKGTFEITLLVATPNGCADTTSQTISLEGPEGMVTAQPTAICTGDEITFTLSGLVDVDTWIWDFPNGTTQTGSQTVVYVYDMSPPANGVDTIKVLLQGASSTCEFTVQEPFNVSQTVADLSGIEPVYCKGEEIFFNTPVTGTNTVTWDLGNGIVSNEPQFTYVYPAGGRYTINLTVTDALVDCEDMASIDILVVDSIMATPLSTIVCAGEMITLPITGVQDYHQLIWTPNTNGLTGADGNNPVATVTETTSYTLTTDNPGGCHNTIDEFNLLVNEGAFRVPNAFTPGLSENNFFNLVPAEEDGLDNITISLFEVYNRWGQKVYDNDTPATGWDGMHNGKVAASDVYLYNIEIEIDGCEAGAYRGNVTLIR